MLNFTYENPTQIVFGRGTVAQVGRLIPRDRTILMTYGGGSIKRNGVYDQVMKALKGRPVLEFGGIEPNPSYETLMKALPRARREGVDFLLSVGGGSVLDGTKFIAAAIDYEGEEPWDILAKGAPVKSAVPLGCVLTLPATGSEMNRNAVISRRSTKEKLVFTSRHTLPKFAVLDPTTTFSLPPKQTANGIVDAFVHVLEQYLTYDVNAPLQDRQAEAILRTLVEEGPKVMKKPKDYDARANVMWCATQALNGLLSCGVPGDWATHQIGHELTAFYGVDHAESLAIAYPAVMRHQRKEKAKKLRQYGERVWGIREGSRDERIEAAIEKTEEFFRSLGVKTRLKDYGIAKGLERIGARFQARGASLGERGNIGPREVGEILTLCRK
ncbi:MAG: iron-containing alcohol dehydrogenase [Candidatus Sumerlaeota bacterium]|nr:iron-containing alcohol dehydrogenase [Candidatus Sumerlaeota bacterium]